MSVPFKVNERTIKELETIQRERQREQDIKALESTGQRKPCKEKVKENPILLGILDNIPRAVSLCWGKLRVEIKW